MVNPAVAALLSRNPNLISRLSEYMNPILVKEVRQALNSRVFLLTFMTMLFVCWSISVAGSLMAGEKLQYVAYAPLFFTLYASVLMVALFVIVPFSAYTSLQSERQEATFDVLTITTLGARRIVFGKMANALVQILIFFIAITPFVAFTSLLQGFQLANVCWVMLGLFYVSVTLSAVGIVASSLATKRFFQGVNMILFIAGLLLLTLSLATGGVSPWSGSAIYELSRQQVFGDHWVIWLGFGIAGLFAAIYSWLALEVAVARITFVSDNRSTAIRVCFLILLTCWQVLMLCLAHFIPTIPEILLSMLVWTGIQLVVICWFSTTEPMGLSRRLHNRIHRNLFSKVLGIVFAPGAGRGMIYTLMMATIFVLVAVWMQEIFGAATTLAGPARAGPASDRFAHVGGTMGCFAVIYAAFGLVTSDAARRSLPLAHSGHVRMMSLILIGAFAVVPFIAYYIANYKEVDVLRYNISFLLNPLSTLSMVIAPTGGPGNTMNANSILTALAILSAVAVFFASPLMFRAVYELFTKPERSRLSAETFQGKQDKQDKSSEAVLPAEVAG